MELTKYMVSGSKIYQIDWSCGVKDYIARPIYSQPFGEKVGGPKYQTAKEINERLGFQLLREDL